MTSLTVLGRRWFQKTNGNTYHSVVALVDGVEVVNNPFEYGYGNQWEWNAMRDLKEKGLLPGLKEHESLYTYCERNKIVYVASVTDVQRKKDL